MAESFLFSIAESLVAKLASSAYEEASRVVGVYHDLHEFKKTLSYVKAVLLDADQKKEKNHELQEWLRQIKHVFSDAENLLDEFECQTLRKQVVKAYGTTKTKVGHFFSSSNSLIFRHRMAKQIKEIRKRLDKVAADRHKFGLQEIDHVDTRVVVHTREMTYSTVNHSDVIGREHDKELIIQSLMQHNACDNDKSLSVIPIVGMGGLGKTTLAKFVYNDKRIDKSFPLKMWVCVSDDFDIKQLIIKIINSAYAHALGHQQNLKELDMEQLQDHLRNKLVDQNLGTGYYFQIHDLVHDLALCVAKEECLMINSPMQNISKNIQHLSFAGNNLLGKSFTPNYVGVRTILFPIEGVGASSKIFLNMCLSRYIYLRILDLSDSTYETLPRSIGKLKHLRYLSLARNCKIKRVPDSICKLPNLQVLDLSGCIELDTLPKGLRNLICLQQLVITTKQYTLPDNDVANLISLEILMVESCENLESLFGGIKLPTKALRISNCGSLKSLPLDVDHFPQLETLVVQNCGNLELSGGYDDQNSNLRLKAIGLSSLPQLKILPRWVQESANTLQSLLIIDCENLVVLPPWLSTLIFMKSIVIRYCPKLKSLPYDFHRLTALGHLSIEGCPELCRKCQPQVGEYWPKISHIKQVFIADPEDLEEELVEEELKEEEILS